MARQLVSEQTPTEYFKELVEEALTERHLQAGDLTEYYLVNLLCQYVRPDSRADHLEHGRAAGIPARTCARERRSPNSGRACEASATSRSSCPASSPTVSAASLVDVDYYKSMGEYAYGSLSRSEHDTFARGLRRAFRQVCRLHGRPVRYQRTNRDHARFGGRTSSASTRSGCGPAACATASGWSSRAAPEPVDRSPVRSVDQPTRRADAGTPRRLTRVRAEVRVLTQVQPLVARPTPDNREDKVSPGRQPDVGRHDVGAAPPRCGECATSRYLERTEPNPVREPHGADRRLNGHHATPTANEWSGWLVNITS